jgi:hypothetical protein
LHGTLFEFLRNSKLDARNFFDLASVPPFRRNQFGGALGGPVKKDKLFLFGNYEGFRQALAISSVSVVPDSFARRGLLPNGKPVPKLDPAILPYMAIAGQPGAALSYNNPRQHIREDFGTIRSDYVKSDRDTVSTAYTIDDGDDLLPLADPLFGSNVTLRSQVASLEETHIFSPRVLNTFTAGFSRAAFNYDSFPVPSPPLAPTTPPVFGTAGICSLRRRACKAPQAFISGASAYGSSACRITKMPLRVS